MRYVFVGFFRGYVGLFWEYVGLFWEYTGPVWRYDRQEILNEVYVCGLF